MVLLCGEMERPEIVIHCKEKVDVTAARKLVFFIVRSFVVLNVVIQYWRHEFALNKANTLFE